MTDDRDRWRPTSAGGTTGVHPGAPGQSLGQRPDPDDDDRDEAGDRDAAVPRGDAPQIRWSDPDDAEAGGDTSR